MPEGDTLMLKFDQESQIKQNYKDLQVIKQRLIDIQTITCERWRDVDQDITKFYIFLGFIFFVNVFVIIITTILLLTVTF